MTTPEINHDVLCGDVIEMAATLEPGSINSVVTSPPYAMQRASTYGGVPGRRAQNAKWWVRPRMALRAVRANMRENLALMGSAKSST